MLCELVPSEPENLGLLALMLLQDARRRARVDAEGRLVTLDEQDRSLWDHTQIQEGAKLTEDALRMRRIGPYQLQAAISAVHCQAASAAETDWRQIAALYRELYRVTPSPVVALNHAVAVAMADGFERGLEMIDQISAAGDLDRYYLLPAARADLLRRSRRYREAAAAYHQALALAENEIERAYLRRRLAALPLGTDDVAN
jgi:RNA polymerase sigma-70 factor (ECF subfamily)